MPIFLKSGSLNLLELSGPVKGSLNFFTSSLSKTDFYITHSDRAYLLLGHAI